MHRLLIDPAFLTTRYVVNCQKTSFGAECGASVLICPRMHCHGPYTAAGPPTMYGQ